MQVLSQEVVEGGRGGVDGELVPNTGDGLLGAGSTTGDGVGPSDVGKTGVEDTGDSVAVGAVGSVGTLGSGAIGS